MNIVLIKKQLFKEKIWSHWNCFDIDNNEESIEQEKNFEDSTCSGNNVYDIFDNEKNISLFILKCGSEPKKIKLERYGYDNIVQW